MLIIALQTRTNSSAQFCHEVSYLTWIPKLSLQQRQKQVLPIFSNLARNQSLCNSCYNLNLHRHHVFHLSQEWQHIQRVSVKVIHDDENHEQVLHIFFAMRHKLDLMDRPTDSYDSFNCEEHFVYGTFSTKNYKFSCFSLFRFDNVDETCCWLANVVFLRISTKGDEIEFDYQSIDFGLKLTF